MLIVEQLICLIYALLAQTSHQQETGKTTRDRHILANLLFCLKQTHEQVIKVC